MSIGRRAFIASMISLPMVEPLDLSVCVGSEDSKTCRYLHEVRGTNVCLKLSPRHRRMIDKEVELFKEEYGFKEDFAILRELGLSDFPLGDNCAGKLSPILLLEAE